MAASVITPDSSVLIAGYAPEHPFFEQASLALLKVSATGRLVAHTMAETYSVLTGRYPHPPGNVIRYLDQFLEREPFGLAPNAYSSALRTMAGSAITGGSIYDGLIAVTAAEAGLRLLSLDRRAARTYALLGADYEILI